MSEELPEKLEPFDPAGIKNREWLWLEDSCGVNAVTAKDHPMRLIMAFKALALRRWEAAQGRPPKITFADVVDGTYDHVELVMASNDDEDEDAGNPPTADGAE